MGGSVQHRTASNGQGSSLCRAERGRAEQSQERGKAGGVESLWAFVLVKGIAFVHALLSHAGAALGWRSHPARAPPRAPPLLVAGHLAGRGVAPLRRQRCWVGAAGPSSRGCRTGAGRRDAEGRGVLEALRAGARHVGVLGKQVAGASIWYRPRLRAQVAGRHAVSAVGQGSVAARAGLRGAVCGSAVRAARLLAAPGVGTAGALAKVRVPARV